MSIKPRVSVIIPTYNDSKNLIIAIESVLAQSFKELEIIVVDDGSTDETKNILKPYIESNKIIYLYQENSGVRDARVKGISIAEGEYIAFLDSDDEWVLKDKIENQIEFLDNNREYVLVGTGVINVDNNDKEINRYLMPETDEKIRQKILRINTFINSSVLLRKTSLEKVGNSESILEDYDLWLKLGTVGEFKNLPIYAVKFRINFQGHGAINKNERLRENIVLSNRISSIA